MSDEADRGNDAAEFFLGLALKEQSAKVPGIPKGIGMCFNCDAEVQGDARWCDTDCRADWERAQVQRQNKVADE